LTSERKRGGKKRTTTTDRGIAALLDIAPIRFTMHSFAQPWSSSSKPSLLYVVSRPDIRLLSERYHQHATHTYSHQAVSSSLLLLPLLVSSIGPPRNLFYFCSAVGVLRSQVLSGLFLSTSTNNHSGTNIQNSRRRRIRTKQQLKHYHGIIAFNVHGNPSRFIVWWFITETYCRMVVRLRFYWLIDIFID
jgi:hypothetical protein